MKVYYDKDADLSLVKGKKVTVEPDIEPEGKVIDLMEALKASVAEHKQRAGARPTGSKRTSGSKRSTPKRHPAKRTAKSASKRSSA